MNDRPVRVLFVYRNDALEEMLGPDGSFLAPTEFFWGAVDLDRTRYAVSFVNAPRLARRTGLRRLLYPIETLFARQTRIGLPLEIYPMFREQIEAADHVICVNDQISLALLFWRRLGRIRSARLHCIVMSLPERLKYFAHRRAVVGFVSKLLQQADSVLTLSSCVQDDFETLYGVQRHRQHDIRFGVDTDFWCPSADRATSDYVLSIGNDMNRDFETLIDALPPGVPLKILTKRQLDTFGKNVEVINETVTNEQVRALYQHARLVVIPSIPLQRESSGLSTTLQAMACRRPVLLSDARTIMELFEDGIECEFFRAGDRDDLGAKIGSLWNDEHQLSAMAEAGYRAVCERFTAQHLSARLDAALAEHLS